LFVWVHIYFERNGRKVKYIVTVLDCSMRVLFTMGLYYSQILNTTAVFNSTLSTLKQYLSTLPFYSSFTGDSSNRTVSSRLQHTTQDCTLQ
jgi:hypothetical protein